MQFLSRFSKSKDSSSSSAKNHRRHSTPPPSTQSTSSYLPLSLPSSSLLRDESLAIPLGTTAEESLDETPSSRSVDTTPWIEVAHDLGGGGSPRISSSRKLGDESARRSEDPLRIRKEQIKLEKCRIETEQMITLMEECGEVIRSRGLTTLGIFRPYRLPESLSSIRQLCLLFLDYISEFDLSTYHSSTTTRGSQASKTVKLHRFKEELRYAEIHNVVATLKWGLRHFSPSAPFALSSSSPSSSSSPFEFYRTYLDATSAAGYPHSSFTQYLLPLLPMTSQSLLVSTLNLIQAVSSYSEINAMTCRKLCRSIGYYIFQSPSTSAEEGSTTEGDDSWAKFYDRWKESGQVLEGLAKSYLFEQSDLPPRLQELVSDFPKFVEKSKTGSGDGGIGGRKLRVLKVEMESRGEGWKRIGEEDEKVNDQETGYLVGGERSRYARRKPVEILLDAFEAESSAVDVDRGALSSWSVVREKGKEGSIREILDEEIVRVLDLLGLTPSTATATADDRPTSPRRRVTSGPLSSLSEESPSNGSSNGFSNFPNKSVSHLSPPSRVVTPSWNDFAQTGFSNGTTNLKTMADEFGRFDSNTSIDATPVKRIPKREKSKIIKIEFIAEIEEEFADLWLDTLVELTTTSSPVSEWPSLVLVPLHSSLSSSLSTETSSPVDRLHLLVCDELLPLVDQPVNSPPPSLHRGLSRNSSKKGRSEETSSLNPRKWTKRASSIFGGGGGGGSSNSTRRETSLEGTDSAVSSTKSKKTSRRSMFIPNMPPPVPLLPRRLSADPAPSPSSPQPYSVSPLPSPDGNVITRTISRTMQRRKSKSSISSPQSEEERQLASPPKFEAELLEPVPAIPAKYSIEVEEAKRRSQTSPLSIDKALPEEPRNSGAVEVEDVKFSAVPLVPSSPPQQPTSTSSPETPFKEVLLEGQPILGAALGRDAPETTENAIPLADSPTISRAAAIRTPSSEATSLLMANVTPPPTAPAASTSTQEETERLFTPETSTKLLEPVTSPTFTLSPPEGEPELLPSSTTTEEGAVRENLQRSDEDKFQARDSEQPTENMGLGLSNVGPHDFSSPSAFAPQPSSTTSPETERPTPASPTNLAAPLSPSIDASANPDSPTIPASPTPSGTSQTSSSSKKFLARTRSFLSRKKSGNALDKEKKSEAKREKELRKSRDDELRNSARKERQVPTPVSSVKKRVAELEAANAAEGGSVPSTPTTTSRIRKVSSASPTPASPTPLPSSQEQPGSAASSIVPLPLVERSDLETENRLAEDKENGGIEEEEEEQEESSPLRPDDSTQEVVHEVQEEEHSAEIGLSTTNEDPTSNLAKDKSSSQGAEPETIPTVVINVSHAQEQSHVGVKVPSPFEDLHPQAPSPTPQVDLVEQTEPRADTDLQASTLPVPEEGLVSEIVPSGDPAQEENHLSVKIPSNLEDLPSPLPSPSPAPLSNDGGPPANLLDSDSTNETISEQTLRTENNLLEQESPVHHHERNPTEATVVFNEEQSHGETPQTPLRNVSTDPSALVTPIAPSASLFTASNSPASSVPITATGSDDPFIDSTPVKTTTTTTTSSSSVPPLENHEINGSPILVSSQSRRSISTKNSHDTFETAAAPSSTLASASSSLHEHLEQ